MKKTKSLQKYREQSEKEAIAAIEAIDSQFKLDQEYSEPEEKEDSAAREQREKEDMTALKSQFELEMKNILLQSMNKKIDGAANAMASKVGKKLNLSPSEVLKLTETITLGLKGRVLANLEKQISTSEKEPQDV